MDREISFANISRDYLFLRSNYVSAKTTLQMLGMAYVEEKEKKKKWM